MIWIAALLLAAIPHVSNPWALSALIFVAVTLVAYHLKVVLSGLLQQVTSNQQKIYKKIG